MKITICGSMSTLDKMLLLQTELEHLNHTVRVPQIEIKGPDGKTYTQMEYDRIRKAAKNEDRWVWDINREAIKAHFVNIAWGDAILVSNNEKEGIPNYIGPNTLMEMGLALFLGKKIYILNDIPEIPSKEEILGINPAILNGNLSLIS